jgi:aspartate aminotransferase
MFIAKKALTLADSETVAMAARAAEMKQRGISVIALAAGEPDFDTPGHIKQAGIKAIQDGFTKYTPAAGTTELRQAIAAYFKRNNGLDYQPSQIIVTNGGKHAIYNAVLATLEEGDEVVIPAPYWVTYPEMIKLAGARAVIIPTTEKSNFKITPDDLKKAITKKTRMFILNSPSNPTGSVYNREELAGLAKVLQKTDIYVLTDEIYEKIIYDGTKHVSLASFDPELKERCLVVNGASKAFAMTGWRIGWLACNQEIAKVVNKIQGQTTLHPCSIAQKAATAALNSPQDFLREWVRKFDERRQYVVKRLNAMPGITCIMPQGAFYVFPRMTAYIGKKCGTTTINNSTDFVNFMLDQAQVAMVQGSAFGAEGYFRISYAVSMSDLEQAMNNIEEALKKLT